MINEFNQKLVLHFIMEIPIIIDYYILILKSKPLIKLSFVNYLNCFVNKYLIIKLRIFYHL